MSIAAPKTFTTTSGDAIVLSPDASAFGFPSNSIVHFTKSRFNGKVALLRGVCANGMLWFSMFPNVEAIRSAEANGSLQVAEVQTTSCRGREEYIRQYGWMVEAEGGTEAPSSSA